MEWLNSSEFIFMAHIHCLNGLIWLANSFIIADIFKILAYYLFGFIFVWYGISLPKDTLGNIKCLCFGIAAVFISCLWNYAFHALVIFKPYYLLQAVFLWISVIADMYAIYYTIRIWKNKQYLDFYKYLVYQIKLAQYDTDIDR